MDTEMISMFAARVAFGGVKFSLVRKAARKLAKKKERLFLADSAGSVHDVWSYLATDFTNKLQTPTIIILIKGKYDMPETEGVDAVQSAMHNRVKLAIQETEAGTHIEKITFEPAYWLPVGIAPQVRPTRIFEGRGLTFKSNTKAMEWFKFYWPGNYTAKDMKTLMIQQYKLIGNPQLCYKWKIGTETKCVSPLEGRTASDLAGEVKTLYIMPDKKDHEVFDLSGRRLAMKRTRAHESRTSSADAQTNPQTGNLDSLHDPLPQGVNKRPKPNQKSSQTSELIYFRNLGDNRTLAMPTVPEEATEGRFFGL